MPCARWSDFAIDSEASLDCGIDFRAQSAARRKDRRAFALGWRKGQPAFRRNDCAVLLDLDDMILEVIEGIAGFARLRCLLSLSWKGSIDQRLPGQR